MSHSVNYHANSNIFFRFYDHIKLGLSKKLDYEYEKNEREKLGNLGLWCFEHLPGKVWRLMKEPRWITLVLTTLSTFAVSYAFYSQQTMRYTKFIWVAIPKPSFENLKFCAYLTTVLHILSAGLRAEGRFSNQKLMQQWYQGDLIIRRD